MSGVYVITDGEHFKIGVADDPMKRLREKARLYDEMVAEKAEPPETLGHHGPKARNAK